MQAPARRMALLLLLTVSGVSMAEARPVAVQGARLWTAPDHTRVVFDLTGRADYRVFRLHKPERVVVDIRSARLKTRLGGLVRKDPVLSGIRHGRPQPALLRLVLDVREPVRPRSFLLKPMQGKSWRLVVDLMRETGRKPVVTAARARKAVTIAVDAGHGGEDPGAIGPHGVKEKDVTLAVAKRLARAINRRPGMRAVLIRKGDYFIPLARRVALARAAHADLLISIHADSVRRRDVAGASVYTMSEKGASDHMAAMLARKENASDAIGGVMPGEVQDPLVNRILADLTKRDSLDGANLLASEMLRQIRRVGPVKYGVPKHARFVVLGAPEIPSVLVELDYISNPRRERLLRSRRHQEKLARALLAASESFLRREGRLPASSRAEASAAPRS